MVHSYSSVVLDVLQSLSERGLNVEIIATESRPILQGNETKGLRVANQCEKLGLQCTVIPDTAVAIFMRDVDCVLVGCEAVLANGGIVNKIGTFGVALIAGHFKKPVYVFTESYKFMQEFPLG